MRWPQQGWHVVSVMAPDEPLYKGWSPCTQWCREQFGGSYGNGGWRFIGEGVFEFREEKHAAWFLLRWQ